MGYESLAQRSRARRRPLLVAGVCRQVPPFPKVPRRIHLGCRGVLRHRARMDHGRCGRRGCIGHDWVDSPDPGERDTAAIEPARLCRVRGLGAELLESHVWERVTRSGPMLRASGSRESARRDSTAVDIRTSLYYKYLVWDDHESFQPTDSADTSRREFRTISGSGSSTRLSTGSTGTSANRSAGAWTSRRSSTGYSTHPDPRAAFDELLSRTVSRFDLELRMDEEPRDEEA